MLFFLQVEEEGVSKAVDEAVYISVERKAQVVKVERVSYKGVLVDVPTFITEMADLVGEVVRMDLEVGQGAVGDTLEEHQETTTINPVAVVVDRTTLARTRIILWDIRQTDMALFKLTV